MGFNLMSFANPWGLLGLLALPAIAIIHLYRQRFPPLMVAGLQLWGVEATVRSAGRRRDRLPITATLLLELLAALLLSLLLADPRFGEVGKVTHFVIVLDNSASMSAVTGGAKPISFRDAAVHEIEDRIHGSERGSVMTLILTGPRPVMLAGPAVPWDQAHAALQDWQPALPQHDFQPAWDLAAQLAEDSGELLFLTDHVPPASLPLPKPMEVVSVGRALDNVAIATARWIFDSSTNHGHIFLRLRNLGRQSANATIEGRAKNQTLFSQAVAIDAGAEVPLETDVPGGLGDLRIRIHVAGDCLAVDDSVTLIEPKVRMLTVANTLPAQTTAYRLIDRVLRSVRDLQTGDASSAQLVIGPAGKLPPSRRDLWWLGIGPLDPSEEARKQAKDLIGPYLLEKRHPLLDGVVLGGVVWGGVQPVDFDVTPLISAGQQPLLARLNGTQTTAYLVNIDLDRSNLTESPDWPILLNNLIELRRENLPGLRRWNYRLNEDIHFRLFEGAASDATDSDERLVLTHDGRDRPLARAAVVEVPPLDETGLYTIRDSDRTIGQFAVNFYDVGESTLTDLRPGIRQPELARPSNGFNIDSPYSWFVMFGLVLIVVVMFADWFVLKPKQVSL